MTPRLEGDGSVVLRFAPFGPGQRRLDHVPDVAVELGAVAGVHVLDGVGQATEERLQTVDERLPVRASDVGAPETPVLESAVVVDHDVAGEDRRLADEGDVVGRVSRRVDDLERLVAGVDAVAIVERVRPSGVLGERVAVGVEGVENGVELPDVIAVLVGEYDRVEGVGVSADRPDNAVHRAGVDEGRALPEHQVRVAGERLRLGSDVMDSHTRRFGTGTQSRDGRLDRPNARQLFTLGRIAGSVMGFGSYDESEQENQEVDADFEDGNPTADDETHDGNVEFEFDASNDELLDKLDEMKDGA